MLLCNFERWACLQVSNVFAGKHGLITPRDLFRWAERGAVGYQQLAECGYMLLAERLRNLDERLTVRQSLERVMNVKGTMPMLQPVQMLRFFIRPCHNEHLCKCLLLALVGLQKSLQA